jgi:hypothetical protein
MVSGLGYPRLLDIQLPNSVADVNGIGRFDYLVVCLDAEELTPDVRIAEVKQHVAALQVKLTAATTLKIIVQNRCIETWFLGNTAVFKRNPQSAALRQFIEHYDVSENDPEAMGVYPGFDTHADFHRKYLQEMLRERNLRYSKMAPGPVAEQPYLEQLQQRVESKPADLLTFQGFLAFCRNVDQLTRPPAPAP